MSTARGLCDGMSALAVFSMRALGIPVTVDFTPKWSDQNHGHTWNSVYDNTNGKHISFMGAENNPGEPHMGILFPTSKIYRLSFSIKNNIGAEHMKHMPHLQYSTLTDVTAEYNNCMDIHIPVLENSNTNNGYAYLSTPGKMEWNAVCFGIMNEDSLFFTSTGKRVLYLPVWYQNQRKMTANYPFWIDGQGNSRFFKPDSVQSTVFTKLNPMDDPWVQKMVGGVFEGANKADFSDAKTLFTIQKMDGPWYHTTIIKNATPFQYVRYVSPKGGNCEVSEIEFYDKTGEKLQGTVIGTTETWFNVQNLTRKEVFDGNPNTFFFAAGDNSWAGLDLGTPVNISQIRYLPRVDGFGIYEGQVYELFYWDGNKWYSLGRKMADNHFLKFDVPSNSLCFLKNITMNKIHLMPCFTENGMQKWLRND